MKHPIYRDIEEARKVYSRRYALLKTGDLFRDTNTNGVVLGMMDGVPLEMQIGGHITPTVIAYVERGTSEKLERGIYGIHWIEWNRGFHDAYVPREQDPQLSRQWLQKARSFCQWNMDLTEDRPNLGEFFESHREEIGDFLERELSK